MVKANREVLNQRIKDYEYVIKEYNNNVTHILKYMRNTVESTKNTLQLNQVSILDPIVVLNNIDLITDFWNKVVEADEVAHTGFSDIKGGLEELNNQLTTFLETIGKNGGNINSIDINVLQQVIFEDEKMFNLVVEKLMNGKKLNTAERELLYQFIQEVSLSDQVIEKVDEISNLIETNNEELKDYINEEVLSTEASLEQEINMLELYLFPGNKRQDELKENRDTRIKLYSYLNTLRNYQAVVNDIRTKMNWDREYDQPLYARIEYIDYESKKDAIRGNIETYIIVSETPSQSEQSGLTREYFLELENPPFSHHNITEVEYYYGPNASENFNQKQQLDQEDEINVYTENFITSNLVEVALNIGLENGLIGIANNLSNIFAEYHHGIKEKQEKLKISILEQTASEFHLELQVNTRNIRGSNNEIEVYLQPTKATFELIDRWSIIHQLDTSIPYPQEEIETLDWIGLNNFLYDDNNKALMTTTESESEVFDYIFNGTSHNDNPIVREAMKLEKRM